MYVYNWIFIRCIHVSRRLDIYLMYLRSGYIQVIVSYKHSAINRISYSFFPLEFSLMTDSGYLRCVMYHILCYCFIISVINWVFPLLYFWSCSYMLQVFLSRKQNVKSKSVTTTALQVFNKHHSIQDLRLFLYYNRFLIVSNWGKEGKEGKAVNL